MFLVLIVKIEIRISWFRNSIRKEDHMPTIALRKQAGGGVGKICTFGWLCESRGKWFIKDACQRKARALCVTTLIWAK